jgi:hypothetical protein
MSGMIRAALVVTLAGAALSGCAGLDGYSVRDEQAVQQDVIGDVVHLGATFCLTVQSSGDGSCDVTGEQAALAQELAQDGGLQAQDGGLQLFAAFLIPASATSPATATAHLPAGLDADVATLTRKPSLDETLEHLRPAPEGRHWIGYISPALGAPEGDIGNGDWSVDADFTLARGNGGLPAPSSFAHAVMGGVRLAYPDASSRDVDLGTALSDDAAFGVQLLASRPVDCQEYRALPFTTISGQYLGSAADAGDGHPLVPTTLCGPTSAGAALVLKDLRGAGSSVDVAPGDRAVVPFTLRYVGAAGPTFTVDAASAVPGATVTPSATALTPARAGFEDMTVTVAVPSGTPTGAYGVTLTTTLGGQVRTAQGTVNVVVPGRRVTTSKTAGEAKGMGDTISIVWAASPSGPVAAPGRPMLELRGFDRSGLGPDGQSINLGDVLCHKPAGSCGRVTVQLSVRWEQLHAGAEVARVAAKQRVRMVTIATARLSVPAQGRRRIRVKLSPKVRRMLGTGQILHAVTAVRAARSRVPLVHRIALQRG